MLHSCSQPSAFLRRAWAACALLVGLTGCSLLGTKEDLVDPDEDGWAYGQDCDDGDATVYPGATELCDGADNDCDGATDESDADDALTWYVDADGDGYGDAANSTFACSQPEGHLVTAGDCDDGDATVYPGANEICDDNVVNDCNGSEAAAMAACGLGGTLSLAGADLKLTGEAVENYAGYSVSGVGDIDGDGRDDVLVGAYSEDSGGTDAGAGYLLLGGGALDRASSSISLSRADLKLTGEADEDHAGYSVSGAGDIDGDGRDDLLVSAPFECINSSGAGAVYLLLGAGALGADSSTLSLSEADLKFTGEADGDCAGYSVSGAGDIDGDGRDDLVVGAPFEDSSGSGAGAVYLLLGAGALDEESEELSLSRADLKLTGEAAEDFAGRSVSGAGDIDGDGRDDLVVGAQYADSGGSYNAGAVYLLLGAGALDEASGELSLSRADLKITGESESDGAGASVSDAGDIDGDGRDDLVVGAPFEDGGSFDVGAVYLLLAGGALGETSSSISLSDADLKLTGEDMNDNAGWSVSGEGDIDGDGLDDLIVGALSANGGTNSGAAYLLLGGGALGAASSPLSLSNADLKLTGEAESDGAGYSVSGAGDIDGDGFDDLLVGAIYEDSGGSDAGATYLLFGGGY